MNPKQVFCSHRSSDKPAVEAFARELRARGVDAWLDKWEIRPGDDIVASINDGLASADYGLVFFSRHTPGGKWVTAEISALIARMIEDGCPVIPVMLDDDAEVPALLRPRARSSVRDLDTIVDAIVGRSSKPPLGPVPVTTGAATPTPPAAAAETDAAAAESGAATAASQDVLDQLIEALEACAAVKDPQVRAQILARLPANIQARVPHAPMMRSHLAAAVATCASFPGGLAALRRAVRFFEGDTTNMHAVDTALAAAGVRIGDADPA